MRNHIHRHHHNIQPCMLWCIWWLCRTSTSFHTSHTYSVHSFPLNQNSITFVSPLVDTLPIRRRRCRPSPSVVTSCTTLPMMMMPMIPMFETVSMIDAAAYFNHILPTTLLLDPTHIPVDAMHHMMTSPTVSTITTTTTTTIISSSSVDSAMSSVAVVSREPIHTAFTIATFLPQPFWILMTLFPNSSITKRCMTGYQIPLLCAGVHLFIVISSLLIQGSDTTAPISEIMNVFDTNGDPQRSFVHMTSTYPDFVAEEWSHVLTWDLFVGRYIWYDGLKKNINTVIPVLFCNFIGPPGLLIYWITCQWNGQPFFDAADHSE